MKQDYYDLDDLFSDLEDEFQDILNKEVATEAKVVMREKVISEVYSPYNPSQYERKEDDGGLSDMRNMKAYPLSGEVGIRLINERMGDGEGGHSSARNVAEIIEYGLKDEFYVIAKSGKKKGEEIRLYPSKNPKNNPNNWKDWKPRRFTKATQDELEESGRHIETFKDALKKRGYDVD